MGHCRQFFFTHPYSQSPCLMQFCQISHSNRSWGRFLFLDCLFSHPQGYGKISVLEIVEPLSMLVLSWMLVVFVVYKEFWFVAYCAFVPFISVLENACVLIFHYICVCYCFWQMRVFYIFPIIFEIMFCFVQWLLKWGASMATCLPLSGLCFQWVLCRTFGFHLFELLIVWFFVLSVSVWGCFY